MVFYNEHFIFDGIDSKDKGIILVDTEERDILMNYGMAILESVTSNTTFNDNHLFVKENEIPEKIKLEFCYVDIIEDEYVPAIWTTEKKQEFMEWIFKEDFCEFISYDNKDLRYILKAVKVNRKFNHEGRGLYIVEFQPFFHHPIKTIKVEGTSTEKTVNINIETNSEKYIYPILKIKNPTNETISIKNETIENSNPLVLHNLVNTDVLTIDNKLYIVSDKDGKDAFKKVKDRYWLKLQRGLNKIKFEGITDYEFIIHVEVRV